jgi:hypothetical protein
MTATAPAGIKYMIKQAVGTCGDVVVNTDFFVFYHLSADNKQVSISSTFYVRIFRTKVFLKPKRN